MGRKVKAIIGRNQWEYHTNASNQIGTFHGFFQDTISDHFGDLHPYAVALVELENGEMVKVDPENITFEK